jgi:hypothetical protein
VTIADGRPHLHRGTYWQRRDIAVESLAILCLAGPAAEELFYGAADDGSDDIDRAMARRYLRYCFADSEIEYQMIRMRFAAERLVASERTRISTIATALLRYGTLTADEISELLSHTHGEGVELLSLDLMSSPPQGPTSSEKVQWYAELMLAGMIFPPISVIMHVDNKFHVVDGHHRAGASLLCNFSHVPAVIVVG